MAQIAPRASPKDSGPMEAGTPADLTQIQEYARRIAERFNPETIILFGSHARGDAEPGSDADLLVLMEFDGAGAEQAYRIRRELPRRFALDLIVRRPRDVERRIQMGDPFLRAVMEAGRVLHERAGS